MKFYLLSILGSLLLLSSCSSTERLHFYKLESKETHNNPKISYHVDSVHQSLYGRKLSLVYKSKFRLFKVNKVQRVLITIRNIASKYYTVGPLLVPILPYLQSKANTELNKNHKLQIDLSAHSDPEFDQEITSVPDLEIVTPDQRTIKASEVIDHGNFKQFTYDIAIKDLPYFWINEARVSTTKDPLVIPRLKFELTREFNYECCLSIGP